MTKYEHRNKRREEYKRHAYSDVYIALKILCGFKRNFEIHISVVRFHCWCRIEHAHYWIWCEWYMTHNFSIFIRTEKKKLKRNERLTAFDYLIAKSNRFRQNKWQRRNARLFYAIFFSFPPTAVCTVHSHSHSFHCFLDVLFVCWLCLLTPISLIDLIPFMKCTCSHIRFKGKRFRCRCRWRWYRWSW